MIGSTWLAEATRMQLLTGQLTGTTITYLHSVGVVGMKAVGASQGPFVDLPINMQSTVQKISRPSSPGTFTPIESSAFFTVNTFPSEPAEIEAARMLVEKYARLLAVLSDATKQLGGYIEAQKKP